MPGVVTGDQQRFGNYPIISVTYKMFFTTNGASDPVAFSTGAIDTVERLTSTGAEEFYRITADTPMQPQEQIVYAHVEVANDIDGGDDFEGVVPYVGDDILSMPLVSPAQQNSRQFDVCIRNGGTRALTNQVAAGRRVMVTITFDGTEPRD